jgi:hypothetical protein
MNVRPVGTKETLGFKRLRRKRLAVYVAGTSNLNAFTNWSKIHVDKWLFGKTGAQWRLILDCILEYEM